MTKPIAEKIYKSSVIVPKLELFGFKFIMPTSARLIPAKVPLFDRIAKSISRVSAISLVTFSIIVLNLYSSRLGASSNYAHLQPRNFNEIVIAILYIKIMLLYFVFFMDKHAAL